jgi:hypothetical protein
MSAARTRPLAWILDRSPSAFVNVIRRRCANDDRPTDPAEVFRLGRASFGKIEWPDGRWLVIEIDHRLAPAPMMKVP